MLFFLLLEAGSTFQKVEPPKVGTHSHRWLDGDEEHYRLRQGKILISGRLPKLHWINKCRSLLSRADLSKLRLVGA